MKKIENIMNKSNIENNLMKKGKIDSNNKSYYVSASATSPEIYCDFDKKDHFLSRGNPILKILLCFTHHFLNG